MATLLVPGDKDFSADELLNIDTISFTNGSGSATGLFSFKQFDGVQILSNLQLAGSAGDNHLFVGGGDLDASAWSFSSWTTSADTITLEGSSADDVLTGSSQDDVIEGLDGNDIIRGGAGKDVLNGGAGNDSFFYDSPSDRASGEKVNGGSGGADAIHVVGAFNDTFIMRSVSIQGVERLVFETAAAMTVTLSGDQIGVASGLMTIERASLLNNVRVAGSQIDLSGVSTGGQGFTLLVEAGPGASATGSSDADFFQKSASATATMSGGDGDDEFLYTRNNATGDGIHGGAGAADRIIMSSIALLDLTGLAALSGVEDIFLNQAASSTLILTAEQMASGITKLFGGIHEDHVVVNLPGPGVADLSGLAFTSWTGGTDTLTINGSAGADTITGSNQADIIVGGGDADSLAGRGGADTFVVSNGDTATAESYSGGGGNDRILVNAGVHDFQRSTISAIEKFEFSAAANVLLQADQIGAGGSIQSVRGSGGSDNLLINGFDIDISGVSFTNWVGSIRMTLAGGGTAIGSSQSDNVIKTGDGLVTLQGGAQNDIFNYRVDDAAGDVIDGGGGNGDEIAFFESFASFDLTQTSITNVERLRFFDFGDMAVSITAAHVTDGLTRFIGGSSTDHLLINFGGVGDLDLNTLSFQSWSNADRVTVNGSDFGNTITGNAAANTLNGAAGADVLNGEGGRDTISGGADNDTIDGGTGNDVLNGGRGDDVITGRGGRDKITGGLGHDTATGGGGNDTFIFNETADSVTGGQRDVITDFTQGTNLIKVSAIASFTFIGNDSFSGTGGAELRFARNSANNQTIVSGDTDGDGTADFQIGLTGLFTLLEADFVL